MEGDIEAAFADSKKKKKRSYISLELSSVGKN